MADERVMRMFVGIEPDASAREALAQWAGVLQTTLCGRYYDADLYHLTLSFLGQVAEDRLDALKACLEALHMEAFSVAVCGADTFKNGSILYAALCEPNEPLFRLQAALAKALRQAGFPLEDTPYIPHITLARHAAGCQGAPLPPRISFRARAVTLFESTRVDGRLVYRPIFRVPLREADHD